MEGGLPEVDPQSAYPALGMLSNFIRHFIDLKKLPLVDFRDEQTINELRAILYGCESAKDKAIDTTTVDKLKNKRNKIQDHKTYTVNFIDPADLSKQQLRVDHFIPETNNGNAPVLIMHGIYSGPKDMVKVIRELTKKNFPVIIFSYPGFASTNRSHRAESIAAGTLSAFRTIKAEGINTVNIFAHSLGAGITAKALSMINKNDSQYPKFRNLVFVAPLDSSNNNLIKIVDKLIASYEELNESHRNILFQMVKRIFTAAWNTSSNLRTASKALNIKHLTVISGEKDAICDEESGKHIAKASAKYTQTQHIHKTDHGHFTMYEGEHMPYKDIIPALSS